MKVSFNQRLAAMGLFLIMATLVSSLLAPDGLHGGEHPRFLNVVTLAEKIKKRSAGIILDVRSAEAYHAFHIPSAKNVPWSEFELSEWGDDTITIYSGDDNLTRKIWSDLPPAAKGRVWIVYGGVHDWYGRVLYPTLPIETNPVDSGLVETINLLSLFYGGQPEYKTGASIEYYRQNFDHAVWPTVQRKGTLVRKGC